MNQGGPRPANPQIQQACLVDVSVWSTSNPTYYDFQPEPSLLDANGAFASYLATLMR